MLDVMLFSINAVMPLLLIILLGYCLRRGKLINEEFLRIGNKLVFYVCLPMLLFYNIYRIDSLSEIRIDLLIFTCGFIVLLFGLGLLVVHWCVPDRKQKGVILQCVFRSNFAIIGIPLSEALGGSEGVQVAALLSAMTIPLYNILAVVSLSIFTEEKEKESSRKMILKVLKKIVRNPLIIGVLCGVLCLALRQLIPVTNGDPAFALSKQLKVIYQTIEKLSKVASPLALLVLGGNFSFAGAKQSHRQICLGTVLRIVLVPCLALSTVWVLHSLFGWPETSPAVYSAYVALYGTPVAVSSAIMAREMRNDGELAGQLVVWTSLLSTLTLFTIVCCLRAMGLV